MNYEQIVKGYLASYSSEESTYFYKQTTRLVDGGVLAPKHFSETLIAEMQKVREIPKIVQRKVTENEIAHEVCMWTGPIKKSNFPDDIFGFLLGRAVPYFATYVAKTVGLNSQSNLTISDTVGFIKDPYTYRPQLDIGVMITHYC